MNEKERKDLALSKIILLTLAFIAIVVIVWLAWMRPSTGAAHSLSATQDYEQLAESLSRKLF